jgi:hypothetical protein
MHIPKANFFLAFLLLLLASRLSVPSALAQTDIDCSDLVEIEWMEVRSRYAALIYPDDEELRLLTITNRFLDRFDQNYALLRSLYNADLDLPITIRVYPDKYFYACYNPVTTGLLDQTWMTSVGAREIALNAANIEADWSTFLSSYDNALRFELGYLFARQITENKAPPGLLLGIAGFMREPAPVMESQDIGSIQLTGKADLSWRNLWEEGLGRERLRFSIAETSVIAYLVDAHGWSNFTVFLNHLRTSKGYRESLAEVYKSDLATLEKEWLSYYHFYLAERWRAHPIYDFDLTPYTLLVESGAYADAERFLAPVSEFLATSGQTIKLRRAQELLNNSHEGIKTEQSILLIRHALLDGRFEEAVVLTNEAEVRLRKLGNDRRQPELDAYRQWAQEALALREEAAVLLASNQEAKIEDRFRYILDLNRVEQRLLELGDEQSANTVSETIQALMVVDQPQEESVKTSHILLAAFLVILRIGLLLRKKPVEAAL